MKNRISGFLRAAKCAAFCQGALHGLIVRMGVDADIKDACFQDILFCLREQPGSQSTAFHGFFHTYPVECKVRLLVQPGPVYGGIAGFRSGDNGNHPNDLSHVLKYMKLVLEDGSLQYLAVGFPLLPLVAIAFYPPAVYNCDII